MINLDHGIDMLLYSASVIPESLEGGFTREEFEKLLMNRLVAIFDPLFPEKKEDVFEVSSSTNINKL